MGSCQEVIRLLTDFLITFGQTDTCVVVCLWMPVCVVSGLVYCILCNIKLDNQINIFLSEMWFELSL